MRVLVGLLAITNSYVESSLDACFVPNRIADNSVGVDQIRDMKFIEGNKGRGIVRNEHR